MKKTHLIDKNLCHRCGACLYKDALGVLDQDAKGYPVITDQDSVDTDALLEGCSGRAFPITDIYANRYGEKYEYSYDSADLGYVEQAGIAYSKIEQIRKAGQSGGVITTLCLGALQMGLVKAILCVKRSDTKPFAATYHIASNERELLEAVRSKYVICSPLEGLSELKDMGTPFGTVSLPCQTHSLRLLEKSDSFVRDKLKFVVGPFCGFNLEEAAGKTIARVCGINPKKTEKFENRGGAFPGVTRVINNKGKESYLIRTYHRILYRAFVPNRCYTCVDYTNEFSDISIADAFMQTRTGYAYPEGAAWVLTRSDTGKKVLDYCIEHKLIEYIPQSIDYPAEYWKQAVSYRKVRAFNRKKRLGNRGISVPDYAITHEYVKRYKPVDRQFALTVALLRNPLIRYPAMKFFYYCAKAKSRTGKKLYTFLGRKIFTYKDDAIPKISFSHFFKGCFKLVSYILLKIPVFNTILTRLAIFFGLSKSEKKNKNIVISGGYGYRNVGDEAQLAFNLSFIKKHFSDYRPIVLSPNPDYTRQTHGVESEYAPRVVFFNSNSRSHYGKSNLHFKLMFFLKTPRLLLNARLAYANLPLIWIHPDEARLLGVLNNARALLLSGGGYLTGSTLSRLWDNALLIRLAHTMNIPVVASGQTIGVFKSFPTRMIAKWGLKKVQYITVRDKQASLEDLASIGLTGSHISSTFDDALFCDASDTRHMTKLLEDNNISTDKPYVAINVHYWGQKPELAEEITTKLARFCDFLVKERGVRVVLLPMHPVDEQACDDLIKQAGNPDITKFVYPYDYRDARGLIKHARCCITMKHHPIVFACGEAVPVMSMVFDDYYKHKNQGALSLFDMQDYVLMYDSDTFDQRMIDMYDLIDARHEQIKSTMQTQLKKYMPDAGKCLRLLFESIDGDQPHDSSS